MDKARSNILLLIGGIWRRRLLWLIPLAVSVPVSISAAMLLPGGFVARSLVLLQENNAGNPLSREGNSNSSERQQERLPGLRALLTSEYVLGQVLTDLQLGAGDSKQRATQIQELRKRLNLVGVGGDFLEFQLSGGRSAGLGRELATIMIRFFAVLYGQSGISVGDALLAEEETELKAAEERRRSTYARLTEPESREHAEKELARVASEIDLIKTELGRAQEPGHPVEGDASEARSREGLGSRLENLQADRARLEQQLNRQPLEAEAKRRELAEEVRALDAAILSKRELYEAHRRQLGTSGSGRAARLLTAPDRAVMIDAPTDPELRTARRLYVFVAGVFSGGIIGLLLAAAAELLDKRIYRVERLIALSGLPVMARLSDKRGLTRSFSS
jgi:hypothetical protein